MECPPLNSVTDFKWEPNLKAAPGVETFRAVETWEEMA